MAMWWACDRCSSRDSTSACDSIKSKPSAWSHGSRVGPSEAHQHERRTGLVYLHTHRTRCQPHGDNMFSRMRPGLIHIAWTLCHSGSNNAQEQERGVPDDAQEQSLHLLNIFRFSEGCMLHDWPRLDISETCSPWCLVLVHLFHRHAISTHCDALLHRQQTVDFLKVPFQVPVHNSSRTTSATWAPHCIHPHTGSCGLCVSQWPLNAPQLFPYGSQHVNSVQSGSGRVHADSP